MSRERLLEARTLLQKKWYTEAAAILRTLPDEPQAQHWLKQMEERGLIKVLGAELEFPEPDEPAAPEPEIPDEILSGFTPVFAGALSLEEQLQSVQSAVERGDKETARTLLRDILRENPSAEAWYLAACVSDTEELKLKFLEKALEFDPFHERTSRMLSQVKQRKSSQIALRTGNVELALPRQDRNRLTASQLLSQAVIVFGNHDWEVKHVTSEMAHFEKKQGVKPALAFIIIIALGLLGSLFIILDIMSRRKEVVTLQIYPDGTLMGTSTQRGQYRYENLEQLRDLAGSVRTGITAVGEVLVAGLLISAICWFFIF